VYGASAGMHLSLRLPDGLSDVAIRDGALAAGIVVNALSTQAV